MAELDRQREPLTVSVNTEHSGDWMGFDRTIERENIEQEVDELCEELRHFLLNEV